MNSLAKWLLCAGSIVIGVLSQPVQAQHLNASGSPCRDQVVTSDLARCLGNALAAADTSLSSTYERIKKALEKRGIGGDITNLVQSEQAWTQFRDSTCGAEYLLYGSGSGGPSARFACLEAQTRVRESDLLTAYSSILEKWGT